MWAGQTFQIVRLRCESLDALPLEPEGELQLEAERDLTCGLELRLHNVQEYRFLCRRQQRGLGGRASWLAWFPVQAATARRLVPRQESNLLSKKKPRLQAHRAKLSDQQLD